MSESEILRAFEAMLDHAGKGLPSDFVARVEMQYRDEDGVDRTIVGTLSGRPCAVCGR